MVPIGRRRHIEGRIDRSREASSYDVKTNDGNGYVEREMTSDTDTKKKKVLRGNRGLSRATEEEAATPRLSQKWFSKWAYIECWIVTNGLDVMPG